MIELATDPLITERPHCRRLFEDALREAGLGGLARPFAEGLVETLEKVEVPTPPPPPGTFALISRNFNYVIRNQDLDVHRHVVGLLAALASMHYVFADMKAAILPAFAALLAEMARAVWQKRASAEPIQMWVLVTLHQHGPLTSQALAERLSSRLWRCTVADAERILTSLERLRRHDGEVIAVVARASDDRWWTVDLGGSHDSGAATIAAPATTAPTVTTTPQSPREALCELLRTCFNDAELRCFVTLLPADAELSTQLPGPAATTAELVVATVTLLERHRLLTACFDRLRTERPQRVNEVDAVHARYETHGAQTSA